MEIILAQENNYFIDYDIYNMSKKERLNYIILAAIAIFIIGYIFYHSIILSLIISFLSFLYPKIKTREIINKRKKELNMQFKDMLYSLSSSISSGKSMESAFRDVLKDLLIIYPDEETYIILEIKFIIKKLEMNETIECVLDDFAKRTHIEDIQNFADVVYACKRAGGNVVEIIKNTSNIISDKLEITQEIDTLLAERRLEQKLLNIIPIFLILILTFTSGDYMAPIFSEFIGRFVMTISMGLLFLGYFISKRIMEINI